MYICKMFLIPTVDTLIEHRCELVLFFFLFSKKKEESIRSSAVLLFSPLKHKQLF